MRKGSLYRNVGKDPPISKTASVARTKWVRGTGKILQWGRVLSSGVTWWTWLFHIALAEIRLTGIGGSWRLNHVRFIWNTEDPKQKRGAWLRRPQLEETLSLTSYSEATEISVEMEQEMHGPECPGINPQIRGQLIYDKAAIERT